MTPLAQSIFDQATELNRLLAVGSRALTDEEFIFMLVPEERRRRAAIELQLIRTTERIAGIEEAKERIQGERLSEAQTSEEMMEAVKR